jgi:hypothetical protein
MQSKEDVDKIQEEVQRGKRKTARIFEYIAILLLALGVFGFKETRDVFILAFPACLAYSASLRGLDAKWPSTPNRMWGDEPH